MNKQFTATKCDNGIRLDKFLCARLPDLSRKQVKALLNDGLVLINGKCVIIAGWELNTLDRVIVNIEPNSGTKGKASKQKGRSAPLTLKSKDKIKIYFEDKDLIVVEKPAGLLSVVGKNNTNKDNLYGRVHNYLKRKHPDAKGVFVSALHRLDVETSGLMVFALSNYGKRLEYAFRQHLVQRTYAAIVFGKVQREQGRIRQGIEKGSFGDGRKVKVSNSPESKEAITDYRAIERYPNATLLSVELRTGRTHQIRVHFSSNGFPIIGDKVYKQQGMPKFHRHALHAKTLGFIHPRTKKHVQFKSTLPKDMRELIDQLRMGSFQ